MRISIIVDIMVCSSKQYSAEKQTKEAIWSSWISSYHLIIRFLNIVFTFNYLFTAMGGSFYI